MAKRKAKHPRRPYQPRHTYSALDIAMASTQPMPEAARQAYIAGFRAALHAIWFGAESTPEHWRVMADAVNMVETFCSRPWPDPEQSGNMIDIADESGALQDATAAMREAARLHRMQGGNIRISAAGREALASLVDLLDTIIQTVSHRSALQCHTACEQAIRDHRKRNSADVVEL